MKQKKAFTMFIFGMMISVASKPTDCNYKLSDCTTATDRDLHFYTNCYTPSSGKTDLCENLCGWDLNAFSYECTTYCPEFIEVCVKPRHDNMTSQPSTVTTPVASNSQTTSEVGASELSTTPGGTKMVATQHITEVDSRQTPASSTQPPTSAKMKNGKNHDCIEYSRAQANIQVVVPLVLLLFISIALNFAGFDTTTFKYRMSRCQSYFWSPCKDTDRADPEGNSDIEGNEGSGNETAEEVMETTSFAMAQQSAHSADKQNDIARLIGKITQDRCQRDYQQTLHEFLKHMDEKSKAEPTHWRTVHKRWLEFKQSEGSRPSMHRQLSIEEPANIPSTSQQTPREAAKDNSKENAYVEEETQLLASEPEETGIIDNQHAVTRLDAVDFTDIKLFDILVMVQWSTHHTDAHTFEMPYLHSP